MLYIKKLIICDQFDQDILRLEKVPAVQGLKEAIRTVNDKEGAKDFKAKLRRFINQLDKEFIDYFDMGKHETQGKP